ncbi:MAG: right-handed parallel beta-helix repeat-containing protein [Planctomycetaceae bacterium]
MTRTWKYWLGAITAYVCAVGPVWSQVPPGSSPPSNSPFAEPADFVDDDTGSVRLGERSSSGSISEAGRVQQVQNLADPGPVFDDNPTIVDGGFLPGDESVGFASTTSLNEVYWRVGNTSFDRLGVQNGYTNLNAFVPLSVEGGNALWFLNPRVVLTDSGDVAGSVGMGRRIYNANDDRVYGGSFWWDWDAPYHQLGGSFESIGRYFSLRSNFSLPIGDANEVLGSVSDFSSFSYSGSNIVYSRMTSVENAYQNFDFEVSTPMPLVGQYGIDIGVGGYYLNGDGDARDGAGFSLRTQAQVNNNFWINGLLTTDPVFGANYSMNMELTLPDGGPTQWFARRPVASNLTTSVLRNYRIARKTSTQSVEATFTSPKGGRPLGVAVIDPNAVASGTGTPDDPLMSVADYMALPAATRAMYDIVFVRAQADGLDTNLDTTITLLDGQRLIGDGSGTATFSALEAPGSLFVLPGQTIGAAPILSNSGAPGLDVVTLANANEVTNFTIDGTSTGRGVVGTGIDGFNIHDNTFRNVIDGIVITSDTSVFLDCPGEDIGIISNNTVGGTGATNPVDPGGIVLTHTAGTITYQMVGNNISAFNMFGADITVTGGTLNANDDVAGNLVAGNTFSGNGGGLRMTATGTGTINADVQGNTANNNLGDGIVLVADGPGATFNLETFTGNSGSANRGHGSQIVARNSATFLLDDGVADTSVLAGNTMTGNLLDGMQIVADGSDILIDQISGVVATGNGDDGMELAALNGGSITWIAPLVGNTFTGNGASVPGLGNPSPADVGAGRGNGLEITTMGTGSLVMGGGIDPTLDGGIGVLGTPSSNNFTNNTGNGLAFQLDGGAMVFDGIYNNDATGNGNNGMSIVNNLGGTFVVVNADMPNTADIKFNDFSNNGNAGLFIGGTGAGGGPRAITDLGLLADNNFDRTTSGTDGIQFNAIDNLIVMDLIRNSFIGRTGAGRGIGGRIGGTVGTLPPGGLDMSIFVSTDINGNPEFNTFANNGDAHIGIIFEGGTDNLVEISGHNGDDTPGDPTDPLNLNHAFSGAVDGALPDFNGDGISLISRNARLRGFIKNNTITLNEGDGIHLESVGGTIDDFEIGGAAIGEGNLISQNGLGGLLTTLGQNTFHGIHIVRRDTGQFNNLLIARNVVTQNGLTAGGIPASFSNGLMIDVFGSDQTGLPNGLPDSILVSQNEFTENLGDGIEIRLGADADLGVDIIGNLISGNGRVDNGAGGFTIVNNAASGIQVTENVNTSTDSRGVFGLWQANEISNNANDGIQIYGDTGNQLTGEQLVIGSTLLNPLGVFDPLGNLILDNGGDGVQISRGGLITVGNNTIMGNGTLTGGALIHAGINIDGNFGSNGLQEVEIISNFIAENVGDGIQLLDEGQDAVLVARNNQIFLNQGRGIDILVRPGDTDTTDSDNVDPGSPGITNLATGLVTTDVTLIGNEVIANDLEGIYIVGTNDTSQSQSVSSSVALAEGGQVTRAYQLRLDIHDNRVVGNGINSAFPATGLVLRVGTTDGGFGPTFAGGFATDGLNIEDLNGDGILDNDINGDGFLNAADNSFVGGVSASITNNYFDGNNGEDVLFHSFRSTVDPNTGTTWDAMTYNPMGYQSDPLARLDLIFTGNTLSSIEANNGFLNIVNGGEPGAFYNNADAVFKSRAVGMNPEDGPFAGGGARRRNAQRLASRYVTNPPALLPINPNTPDFETFLYPGMGDSTFRVIGGTNTFLDPGIGVVTLDQIFIFDDPTIVGNVDLVDDTFEANGVFFTGGNQFGELPFGWGTFDPGRTGFTNP